MVNKAGNIRICLADLTHTGIRIAAESMPLNIGVIASYLKKRFGSRVQVRLFKYPEKLLHALRHERFDIVGCSTYIWNKNLTEWILGIAKERNPRVLTVRGGPDFPLEAQQQYEYLKGLPHTDVYCINEGEESFSRLIERITGSENDGVWAHSPIEGCAFVRDGTLVRGALPPRIMRLDDIPSPYTSGLLDEFFDGKLTPMIETARGCPFTCNYCNAAQDYYTKTAFFSPGYVREEIEYIAKKVAPTGITNLLITDANFGMYPRDKEISSILREAHDTCKWPLSVLTSTGKNHIEKILNNIEPLGKSLIISMSVQSMDPGVLKTIDRANIGVEQYAGVSRLMEKKGISQMAELIVPLPGETYSSYMRGIEQLLEMGVKRIVSYTLQLNRGTVYTSDDYRRRFGYRGRYRLIPFHFGEYEGVKIFDYEEVADSTASLGFSDYLKIRKFALITELAFGNYIFHELFKFLREQGISSYEVLRRLNDGVENAPLPVRRVFSSFVNETTHELKHSEEALVSFYSDQKNYDRLVAGEIGGNVIFRHKGMMLSRHSAAWIRYVFGVAHALLEERGTGAAIAGLLEVKRFVTVKLDGLFHPERTHMVIRRRFRYDLLRWLADFGESPLSRFESARRPLRYEFYFTDDQEAERSDLFNRYGRHVTGLSRLIARMTALERMYRTVREV